MTVNCLNKVFSDLIDENYFQMLIQLGNVIAAGMRSERAEIRNEG
jgi:hypothetical protein